MNDRLKETFDRLRAEGRKAMGLFITNGFPEPAATLEVLKVADAAGADFLELGMPFSDPLAEGPTIQRSSARALEHGVRMADAFRTAAAFRRDSETPLVLMGYYNPVLSYGISNFCADAASSGVDGLILADLPPEESAEVEAAAAAAGLGLVFLVAPNTPLHRMEEIDRRTTGFVYAVSVSGMTGAALGDLDGVSEYLARARRAITRNPLLVGFGIRTGSDAARLSRNTDGFIVGSALIDEIERLWDNPQLDARTRNERLGAFVRSLRPTLLPETA